MTTPIRNRTIGHYLDTLASPAPAPGGGSVAGLVGALAASLGQMVANLTLERSEHPTLAAAAKDLAHATDALLDSAAQDETCYPGYLAASRLPKSTDDEKAVRRQAMQDAMIYATEVPLGLATTAARVLDLLEPIAREGTAHATSDTAIGVNLAEAAVLAALSNVRSNIPLIKTPATAEDLIVRANDLEARAATQANALRDILSTR